MEAAPLGAMLPHSRLGLVSLSVACRLLVIISAGAYAVEQINKALVNGFPDRNPDLHVIFVTKNIFLASANTYGLRLSPSHPSEV